MRIKAIDKKTDKYCIVTRLGWFKKAYIDLSYPNVVPWTVQNRYTVGTRKRCEEVLNKISNLAK